MPDELIPEVLFYDPEADHYERDRQESISEEILLREWWVALPLSKTASYDDTIVVHPMDEYIPESEDDRAIKVDYPEIPDESCTYEIEIFQRIDIISYFPDYTLDSDIEEDGTPVDDPDKGKWWEHICYEWELSSLEPFQWYALIVTPPVEHRYTGDDPYYRCIDTLDPYSPVGRVDFFSHVEKHEPDMLLDEVEYCEPCEYVYREDIGISSYLTWYPSSESQYYEWQYRDSYKESSMRSKIFCMKVCPIQGPPYMSDIEDDRKEEKPDRWETQCEHAREEVWYHPSKYERQNKRHEEKNRIECGTIEEPFWFFHMYNPVLALDLCRIRIFYREVLNAFIDDIARMTSAITTHITDEYIYSYIALFRECMDTHVRFSEEE